MKIVGLGFVGVVGVVVVSVLVACVGVAPNEVNTVFNDAVSVGLLLTKASFTAAYLPVAAVEALLASGSRVMFPERSIPYGFSRGDVVVITGASSGIGEAVAHIAASHGATLVLAARRVNRLQAVADQCRALGAVNVSVVAYDALVTTDALKVVQHTLEMYGRLDTLVLNAGYGGAWAKMEDFSVPFSPLSPQHAHNKSDDDDRDGLGAGEDITSRLQPVRRVMEVNYWGYVYAVQAALPALINTTDHGRIVVVSSMYGTLPAPYLAGYAASKHALQGFFNTLRPELAQHGISVTVHMPGGVRTEVTKRFTDTGTDTGTDTMNGSGKSSGSTRQKTLSMPDYFLADVELCAQSVVDAGSRRVDEVRYPMYVGMFEWVRYLWPSFFDTGFTTLVQKYMEYGLFELRD